MNRASFEISVSDFTSSVDEYRRAQCAPKSELPELTDDQKAVARGFKISEEEYARGVLAGVYGRERQRSRGRRLGEAVQSILSVPGRSDRVVRVSYEMDRARWIVSIESAGGAVDVAVPRELVDDFLDSSMREPKEQLQARVARALGLSSTLAKP